jgi:hypothetical protein
MRIEFDEGTLLLHDAREEVPHAEWDDRVDTYRAQAYRYRSLLEWAGQWNDGGGQATLDSGFSHDVEDAARAYPDLALTPAVQIEPREYQQAALDSWRTHDRQGTVVLPTGSGRRSSDCRPSPTPVSAHSSLVRLQTQKHEWSDPTVALEDW